MMNKLKSRKFWVTFGTAAVVLFVQQLGLDVSPESIYALVALVTGYNAAQGYVDAKGEPNGG